MPVFYSGVNVGFKKTRLSKEEQEEAGEICL